MLPRSTSPRQHCTCNRLRKDQQRWFWQVIQGDLVHWHTSEILLSHSGQWSIFLYPQLLFFCEEPEVVWDVTQHFWMQYANKQNISH